MKKFLALLTLSLLLFNDAKSQYVNIPDSGFSRFLKGKYPGCFNAAGQMDTTCPAIVNATGLSIPILSGPTNIGTAILNIEGVQYFKRLDTLNIKNSYLNSTPPSLPTSVKVLVISEVFNAISLPALPPNLKYFSFLNNAIPSLPELPAGLQYFYCEGNNQLTSLPGLPGSIRHMILNSNNLLTTVPEWPASLQNLQFSGNFTSIPPFPSALKRLDCRSDSLTVLPAFPSPSNMTYLDCSFPRITVLPALPPLLDSFICLGSTLTEMPTLPSRLRYVNVSRNKFLRRIPNLPNGLLKFNCSNIGITMQNVRYRNGVLDSLPPLPNSLTELNCSGNMIRSLSQIPPSLTALYCSYNMLTALPSTTQGVLTTLICDSNLIETLPDLPGTVQNIQCSRNNMQHVTSLPRSLITFDCSQNAITNLPAFPGTLTQLWCSYNRLTSLPALPNSLTTLGCENNNLIALPPLSNTAITYCYCQDNNIYCLPKLPQTLSYFYFDNRIKCIPNQPGGSTSFIQYDSSGSRINFFNSRSFPVCNPVNNVSHCRSYPVMQGYVFYDANLNGIKDDNEPVKANEKISLSDSSYTFTNDSGYYSIIAGNTGNYRLSANSPVYYNAVPAFYNYSFTSYDTIVASNFALRPNRIFDSLSVTITPVQSARPGFSFQYLISYENTGTVALSPNIRFDYDNTRLTYDSSSNAAVTNNGNSLSLSPGNVMAATKGNFIAYFKIKPSVLIGDTLVVNAVITANTVNAQDNNSIVIRGSYDPNDKQATSQLSPSQVANGDYIDYTIRFQNTGTDTAFTVVISDTLSNDLQKETLQMITASHNCKTTVKDNVVFFEFLNILLPDSNVNEPMSHGFVSFKIKPQPTVAVNTIIPNKAAIYFDYNAPVITNTAGTLIKEFTVVPLQLISFSAVPQTDNTTALYWNTANEINTKHFVIEMSNDGLRFTGITNIVAKGKANNHYNAAVAAANTGIIFYRLKIVDNDGSFVYSPVIKIDKRKNTTGFSVLTNPVKDFIIINTTDQSLNNSSASIINMQGAVTKTFILKEGSQSINIEGLPAGVYYLRTLNGSSRIVVR